MHFVMAPMKKQGLLFMVEQKSGFGKLIEQKDRKQYIQTLIAIDYKGSSNIVNINVSRAKGSKNLLETQFKSNHKLSLGFIEP